jgi:CRISPR-associated protein Cas6
LRWTTDTRSTALLPESSKHLKPAGSIGQPKWDCTLFAASTAGPVGWCSVLVRVSACGCRRLIPRVLTLAGQSLEVGGDRLRVGVPQVTALRPAPTLSARIVTTRNGQETGRFDAEIARQLLALGIRAMPTRGPRRCFRIKDKTVIGFGMRVSGLSPDESIRLQEHGLGGRRKMGLGVFVPIRASEDL